MKGENEMTTRRFDIGRQNETMLNAEHYNIYKILEPYIKNSTANSTAPVSGTGADEIADGAIWIDRDIDYANSDLKYFSNGQWNLFFKNRFKITDAIMSEQQPGDPIDGQLWIDEEGVLNYYSKGSFRPIKAVPDNEYVNPSLEGYEDFIITSALTATEQTIVDNFTSWLLDSVPLEKWVEGKSYTVDQGCVHELNIYVCTKEHVAEVAFAPGNTEYWTKIQKLSQYLVPSANEDRFFLDGFYMHQECTEAVDNAGHLHDETCNGYKISTSNAISFPIEMLEGKIANSVHVNPKRLYNIEKKFIMIDRDNPIIEVPEENTEYYAFQGGVGKLLVKTDNSNTTEYRSIVSNNIECIQLSQCVAETYDFIYAIHYEFVTSSIKQLGTVTRKRQTLSENNYVWIGSCNKDNICVFAQGMYYANDNDETWAYDPETGYLYLNEKLQDYDNVTKTFDFSVIEFPYKQEGLVTDNFVMHQGKEMFRINLVKDYEADGLTCFLSGLNIDTTLGEIIVDENNPKVLYIPGITREMYLTSKEYGQKIFYCVVGTKAYQNGVLETDMHRGSTTAKTNNIYGVHVPIYSNQDYPIENALYLAINEAPILFVDGVLVFQSEIERGEDYLTIYGLKEGQQVTLLADIKDSSLQEGDLSERLIFEDTVSYATIPTSNADDTIVYIADGILADATAVSTSKKPNDEGYHGEIRYHSDYDADIWYRFDRLTGEWIDITNETHVDLITGEVSPLIDILNKSARGYTRSKRSISFLQNMNKEACTYYAYAFSNSIEKQLLMGYCYPNGKDGINVDSSDNLNDPQPFKINSRHTYVPGRNEISVYVNGVYQKLNSPNDIDFSTSTVKEAKHGKYDELILAFDDGTITGSPIPGEEGYYIYNLNKDNESRGLYLQKELTDSEITSYQTEGYEVTLVSEPNRNIIFYVIEPTESGETRACTRTVLTHKDSLANNSAYTGNSYNTNGFLLTRGNLRVYINGLRQPYGSYQTLESIENNEYLQSYKVIDSRTIQIQDPIIGGMGGNEGTNQNPLFIIGNILNPDGTTTKAYHEVIDEIVIECRSDLKLREITVPIRDDSGEFSEQDGLPEELFKTKDRIMIYINGMAYGKEYTIENNTIKLLNSQIKSLLGQSKTDIITFEWR